jgi:hypothetical protein
LNNDNRVYEDIDMDKIQMIKRSLGYKDR